jgi:hypothetical protein
MRVYFTREARVAVSNVFLGGNVGAKDGIVALESAVDFDVMAVLTNGWVQLQRDGKLLNVPSTSILVAERLTPLTENEE